MKANEAPEKIFLSRNALGVLCNSWWLEPDKSLDNVEYVRKDAFIEKAANYLNYILYDRVEIKEPGTIIPSLLTKGEFIENFKKYMAV